jgi:hypothetical protein
VKYTAIRSEGGLLPYDLLDEILAETAPGQKAPDFGLPKGRRVSDEIQRVWLDAQELWSRFKVGREKLTDKDPHGTTLTRDRWIGPILTDPVRLSYDLHFQPSAPVLDGLTFTISHRAGEPNDSPPVHIEGCGIELDKRPQKSRVSPQAMVQEFLNRSESLLWGVVTNGLRFRLLRDSVRTARPTYLEFDLETILEGGHYNEFVLFYRLCHRTRLPQAGRLSEDCWLEKYYQLSIEKGGRVRDNLRDGVEEALKVLGTGFLRHPENIALQEKIDSGKLNADLYHRQLLLLVYRLLFLTVAEDRHLVISIGESAVRNQAIYQENYSIGKLRERAEGLLEDSGFSDLWIGLTQTFKLFADSNDTNPLGIPPLNGDLFSHTTIPDLETAQISNLDLLKAIRWLMFYRERSIRQRVNYAALDVEELGSVYESLLDFRPMVSKETDGRKFDLGVGSERKTTGSYYTRPELVRELIQSALVPVLYDRLAEVDKQVKGQAAETIQTAKVKAILGISVCDPACGSGHFLLEAARRLGKELARIRVGEDEPTPEQFHVAVRDVISHCIYGVDHNPLAVDLCKLALWLEGHWAGKPLSFLDHRIRCGNSLIGVLDPSVMADGIPDDAFIPVTGDDKKIAAAYKKRNKAEKALGQKRLEFEQSPAEHNEEYAELFGIGLDFSEDKPSDVRKKAELFAKARGGADWWHDFTAANLWTASFFMPLTKLDDPLVPTQDTFLSYFLHRKDRPQMTGSANSLAGELRFFHWRLEFPDVFERGGFDLVLGNPPWEKINLKEKEFFKSRAPEIANAGSKAARQRLIGQLQDSDSKLWDDYQSALRTSASTDKFIRCSGRFELTATGDINTYAIFAEHFRLLIGPRGRAGMILPIGIATDETTSRFFSSIVDGAELVQLLGFENEAFIFPTVHHSFKFCALTLRGNGAEREPIKFAFFCREFSDVLNPKRLFYLDATDLRLLSPNTRSCPVFRSSMDAALTTKFYRKTPVLANEETGLNPWQVSLRRMLHMSDDSAMFRSEKDLIALGLKKRGILFVRGDEKWGPLYEAKMVHQYDHRFATYEGATQANLNVGILPQTTSEQKRDPEFATTPKYWAPMSEVLSWQGQRKEEWLVAFRKITRDINERTGIFTVLPVVPAGDSLLFLHSDYTPNLIECLIANLNSIPFDYILRQKIGGSNLAFHVLRQLPTLAPESYQSVDVEFVSKRVLELVYTSSDLKAFAHFCRFEGPPYLWDEARREQLLADLDAYYAHLYGLTRDELCYILDPKDVFGEDFPSETFRVLREREQKEYGEYRTQRLVLEAFGKLAESPRFREEMSKRQSVFEVSGTSDLARARQS